MLDKFLALLERFVVAHELIASNSTPKTGHGSVSSEDKTVTVEEPKKTRGEQLAAAAEMGKQKAKPEEDDLANDEPEEKPKTRKTRATKLKAEPEPDLDKLREEIESLAKDIGSGDSDECADGLDDLLDEYDVRSVKKLKDLQVQEFHKDLQALAVKYYDIED